MATYVKQSPDSKQDKDSISHEFAIYQEELNELSRKRKKFILELKRSDENLARQKTKIEGLENESKIAKNYILVANENLIQAKKEGKSDSSMEDVGKKIMQIKETIEREKQRVYSIEKKMNTAKQTISDETNNINSISQTLSDINARRDALLKKYSAIENDLNIASKKELKRKNDISIHKRLSQALSCLTFIIIGIPLGIKLRSGNLMVGFGASFIVILFLYYPLVVTGIVLAENAFIPVIPAIWGANIILFIGGTFIFRRMLVN